MDDSAIPFLLMKTLFPVKDLIFGNACGSIDKTLEPLLNSAACSAQASHAVTVPVPVPALSKCSLADHWVCAQQRLCNPFNKSFLIYRGTKTPDKNNL